MGMVNGVQFRQGVGWGALTNIMHRRADNDQGSILVVIGSQRSGYGQTHLLEGGCFLIVSKFLSCKVFVPCVDQLEAVKKFVLVILLRFEDL